MSSASSLNDALSGYAAGRMTAEQLAVVVTEAFYRETRNGTRETWRPIMEVVERAHPGVVELKASQDRPGFAVRLAERPFPKRYEPELREAVEKVLQTLPVSRLPFPEERPANVGLLRRIVAAVRKLFNA